LYFLTFSIILRFVLANRENSTGNIWTHLHHLHLSQLIQLFVKRSIRVTTQESAQNIFEHFRPNVKSVRTASFSEIYDTSGIWNTHFATPLLKVVAPSLSSIDISISQDEDSLEDIMTMINADHIESLSSTGGYLVYTRAFKQRRFPKLAHLFLQLDANLGGVPILFDIMTKSTGALVSCDVRCKITFDHGSDEEYRDALKRLSEANRSTLKLHNISNMVASRFFEIQTSATDATQARNWEEFNQQCIKDYAVPLSGMRFSYSLCTLWYEVIGSDRFSGKPKQLDRCEDLREICWKDLPLERRATELHMLCVGPLEENHPRENIVYMLHMFQRFLDEWEPYGDAAARTLTCCFLIANGILLQKDMLSEDEIQSLIQTVPRLKQRILTTRETWTIKNAPLLLQMLIEDEEFVNAAAPLNMKNMLIRFTDVRFPLPYSLGGSHLHFFGPHFSQRHLQSCLKRIAQTWLPLCSSTTITS
jgi:hypothetical protein